MTIISQQKFTFVTIFLLSIYHATNAEFVAYSCYPSSGNYSSLSDYGANVEEAITQLGSLASSSYFNTTSVGNGTDEVNALFSCRYDITSDACQSCVQGALDNVPLCLGSVQSIQYYQECTVHYSNSTIFSVADVSPTWFIWGVRNITGSEFTTLLSETISSLTSDVIDEFNASSRYFATKTAEYTASKTIYALAQCNQDISTADCDDCLTMGFNAFASEHAEAFLGQFFRPACTLAYKLSSTTMTPPYDFTLPTASSPPPPEDDSTPPTGSPPADDAAPSTPFVFPDEIAAPPPPGSPIFGGRSKSTGTRRVSSTTMASVLLVLLSCGLLL